MNIISKFITFCSLRGVGFFIDLTFFNLFYFLGLAFVFCRIIGVSVVLAYNFSTDRYITFSGQNGLIGKQLFRYIILYAIASCINLLVGITLISILGGGVLEANIASIVGIAAQIPVTFFGSLFWVFKE